MSNELSEIALSVDRLRWIETWAEGWRRTLTARYGDKDYYAQLPLDVATSMIEELVTALRDPNYALNLISDVLHESGQEIGEAIERRRYEQSANYAEAKGG